MNVSKIMFFFGVIFLSLAFLDAMKQNKQDDEAISFMQMMDNLEIEVSPQKCVCNEKNLKLNDAEINQCFSCWMRLFKNEYLFDFKKNKVTPIHVAASCNHIFILEKLISHGFCINFKNCYGETPLHVYLDDSSDSHKTLLFLLEKKADVHACDNDGFAPVHHVYDSNDIELLINHKADINAIDNEGLTALHAKIFHFSNEFDNDYNFIKSLLLNKAAVNQPDKKGKTPLHLSVFNFDERVIDLLIEHKGLINQVDHKKQTVLHYLGNYACHPEKSDECLRNIPLFCVATFSEHFVKYLLLLPFKWAKEFYDPEKFSKTLYQVAGQDPFFCKNGYLLLLIFKRLKTTKKMIVSKDIQRMIIAFCFNPQDFLKQLVGMKDCNELTAYDWSIKKKLTEITKMLEPYR